MSEVATSLRIEPSAYDALDARRLTDLVQLEYVTRYGTRDEGPADPAEFTPPAGLFGVGYAGGVPATMGGWRMLGPARAEIKRMYVADQFRGRGFARAMLTWLEDTARAGGVRTLVLETGAPQPEAIALYASSGYLPVEPFGYYACAELSVYLGKPL